MTVDDAVTVLQIFWSGMAFGLMFGDFLDRRDPLHWKSAEGGRYSITPQYQQDSKAEENECKY